VSRRNLWVIWAAVIAAAFAIVAITHARGKLYLIIAIVAGVGYTVITMATRDKNAETGQRYPSDPDV